MEVFVVICFVLGYIGITLEHWFKIDKLIFALVMMGVTWGVSSIFIDDIENWVKIGSESISSLKDVSNRTGKLHLLNESLSHHFEATAQILIFLMGAMAIVEMIDYFNGFEVVQSWIKVKSKRKLLIIISVIAFILSAVIDNLTATIVLISILRKIIPNPKTRMYFVGFVIIAANSGGAWTPIGDVTTTILWLNNKVSTVALIQNLLIPSIISVALPVGVAFFLKDLKGNIEDNSHKKTKTNQTSLTVLIVGLLFILFVPLFKSITHLPPYLGMGLSLGLFALFCEFISNRKIKFTQLEENATKKVSPTVHALNKIEIPSLLFFLGILMTVGLMESMGIILNFGQSVSSSLGNENFVGLLGILSAVIDNVPLVAASLGMFHLPQDDALWHMIAFASGTGGSILIIGSAAGVVAMGMEKISFTWYVKKIGWLALLGYFGGLLTFVLLN